MISIINLLWFILSVVGYFSAFYIMYIVFSYIIKKKREINKLSSSQTIEKEVQTSEGKIVKEVKISVRDSIKEMKKDRRKLWLFFSFGGLWHILTALFGWYVFFSIVKISFAEGIQSASAVPKEPVSTGYLSQTGLTIDIQTNKISMLSPIPCACDGSQIREDLTKSNETVRRRLLSKCKQYCNSYDTIEMKYNEYNSYVISRCNKDQTVDIAAPCGKEVENFGTIRGTYTSEVLECAIIDDMYIEEQTKCDTIFRDGFEGSCPRSYNCFEEHDQEKSCTDWCIIWWSDPNSYRAWRYKYHKAATTFVHTFGWKSELKNMNKITASVHVSVGSCPVAAIQIEGQVYCINTLSDLPDWIICSDETITQEYLEEYVRQIFPAPHKCDQTTRFIKKPIYANPSSLNCEWTASGIVIGECVETQVPECKRGTYEINETGLIYVTFDQYCLHEGVLSKGVIYDTCPGCNKDCTWTSGRGTGINDTCRRTTFQPLEWVTNSAHDSTEHTIMYKGLYVVNICYSVSTIIYIIYALYESIKSGMIIFHAKQNLKGKITDRLVWYRNKVNSKLKHRKMPISTSFSELPMTIRHWLLRSMEVLYHSCSPVTQDIIDKYAEKLVINSHQYTEATNAAILLSHALFSDNFFGMFDVDLKVEEVSKAIVSTMEEETLSKSNKNKSKEKSKEDKEQKKIEKQKKVSGNKKSNNSLSNMSINEYVNSVKKKKKDSGKIKKDEEIKDKKEIKNRINENEIEDNINADSCSESDSDSSIEEIAIEIPLIDSTKIEEF